MYALRSGAARLSALVAVVTPILAPSTVAQGTFDCRDYDRRYELVCVQACPEVEMQVLNVLTIGEIYRVYRTAKTSCPGPSAPPIDPCDLYRESGPYVEYFSGSAGYVNGWVDVARIDPSIFAPPGTRAYLKLRRVEGCFDTVFGCPGGGIQCDAACAQDCITTPWLFVDGPLSPHPTFIFDLTGPGTDPDGCQENRLYGGPSCSIKDLRVDANLLCPGETVRLTAEICNAAPAGGGGCVQSFEWELSSSSPDVIDVSDPQIGKTSPLPPDDGEESEENCVEIVIDLPVASKAQPGDTVVLTLIVWPEKSKKKDGCKAELTLLVAPAGSGICGRIDVVFVPVNYSPVDIPSFLDLDVPSAIEQFATVEPFKEYFDYFNFHTVVPSGSSEVPNPYTAPDVDEIVYIWNGIIPGEQVYALQCTPTVGFCYPHPGNGIATIVASSSIPQIMFGLGQSFYPALGVETPGFKATWLLGEGPVAETPNLSTILNIGQLKWGKWIEPPPEPAWFIDCTVFDDFRTPIPTPDCWQFPPGSPEIGMFEGAFDFANGLYRPAFGCLLNELSPVFEFCPVCRQALVSGFYAYEAIPLFHVIEPLESYFTAEGMQTTFRVDPIKESLSVWWFVDGTYLPDADGEEFVLEHCGLSAGTYSVMVTVADTTPWVRKDLYGGMQPQSASWTVQVGGSIGGIVQVPEDVPTLADAVREAMDGAIIRLGPGVHAAADVQLPCNRSFIIEGQGIEETIVTADLDGDGVGDGRILNALQAGFITLRDLTLVAGNPGGPSTGGALNFVDSSGLMLERCRFADNRALIGSAVFAVAMPMVEVVNCIFVDNESTAQAGTVFVADSDLLFRNNTMYRNEGGGLRLDGPGGYEVWNSIWSANGPFGVQAEFPVGVRYSTFWGQALDLAGEAFEDVGLQLVDPLFVDSTPTDPLLVDLHLDPASPSIDGGDPADPYPLEPDFAGCAINQGAYGNTPEAQPTEVISLIVVPGAHYVAPGMGRIFEAVLVTPGGTSSCANGVTWSIDPAGVGIITTDGLYLAPYPPTTLDPVTIIATVQGFSASATVHFAAFAADGDFNGDFWVDEADLALLGDYIFAGGVWPPYREAGDWNGDGVITEDDYFELGQFIEDNGPTLAVGTYGCANPAHFANEFGEFIADPFCP